MTRTPAAGFVRRTLFALPIVLPAFAARAQQPPCPPPRVLLVCPAGTVKSAIAREVLKRRASARGLALQVRSRGVHPENHVSVALAASLRADGIDPAAEPVQAFTPADAQDADIVIAFDEATQVPALRHARVWTTPSWNDDYASAKAALSPQIENLLDEVAASPCRAPAGAG